MFESIRNRLQYEQLETCTYDDKLSNAYGAGTVPFYHLAGKCVAVTGAAGGIGRAVSQRILNEGARVIMIDMDECGLEKACAGMPDSSGLIPVTRCFDLTRIDDVDEFICALMDEFDIDVWINCAGRMLQSDKSGKPESDEALWNSVMDVDLKCVVAMITAFAKCIKRKGRPGTVINIGSILGSSRRFGHTVYALSKAGLIRYGHEAARQYQDIARIFTISPGTCVAPMGEGHFGENISRRCGLNRRLILPEEIAALVAFVAANSRILKSGQEFFATGGEVL